MLTTTQSEHKPTIANPCQPLPTYPNKDSIGSIGLFRSTLRVVPGVVCMSGWNCPTCAGCGSFHIASVSSCQQVSPSLGEPRSHQNLSRALKLKTLDLDIQRYHIDSHPLCKFKCLQLGYVQLTLLAQPLPK